MSLIVLTWNPEASLPEGLNFAKRATRQTLAGRLATSTWSVGRRRTGIGPGDRAYMLCQGSERGLVAHGRVISSIFAGDHWKDADRSANYARVEWLTWLAPEDRLPTERLKKLIPAVNWDFGFQSSGNPVSGSAATAVDTRWAEHLQHLGLSLAQHADDAAQTYREGDLTKVMVNRYERDPRARADCIDAHGSTCAACDFDFEVVYGQIGRGYIHVHHLKDLAAAEAGYRVDPVHDLVPLCPNCHAMIHQGGPPAMSVERLRRHLRRAALN